MERISQVSANKYPTSTANTNQNKNDNNLHGEKLVFSPSELGSNGKRPKTIVLTEKQVETKIFQKYGFDTRKELQNAMLKLRFDTKNDPASEINWGKGQFVAKLNSKGQYEITVNLRERTLEALQGRLISAPPVSNSRNANPNDMISARTGYDAARIKKDQIQNLAKPDLSGLTPEQKELILDLTQVGLSVVGIFDPTGVADGADALISLGRKDYWGSGISALGIIPYLGDLAKLAKLPKLLKTIENVVAMAKTDAAFAKVVTPLLSKLKGALDSLPINKLPNWAKEPIQSLKNKIDEFFSSNRKGLPVTSEKDATLKRVFEKPKTEASKTMPAGYGETDKYGNVTYSTKGTPEDIALVKNHERVHQVLSPKLKFLREFRADLRMTSYQRSSFLRYLEEAMAESYAQLKVNGIKGLPDGIKFPVKNGYVELSKVVKEGAIGTIVAGGITYGAYVISDKINNPK